MTRLLVRFQRSGWAITPGLFCLAMVLCAPAFAQTKPELLFPFSELEFEAAKKSQAVAATQEYLANEQVIKENSALSNSDRQRMRTGNYHSYLKKLQGLLKKDQRKKSVSMLVENDVKGLRQKPAMPRFYDQLELNEKQSTKAKDLYLQQRIKTQTLFHAGDYSPADRSAESRFISEEFKQKFDDLLNSEQRTRLAELNKHAAVLAAIPLPPLFQKLGLNTGQTDRLKQLLFDLQKKLDAISKDPSLTPNARQEESNRINREASQSAEAILSRDQKIKLDDLMSESNYKMPALFAQLELTAEQQEKLKEALLWQVHELAVIKQDAKLTAEQRQQRLTQVNAGLQERFNAFMTPQQLTKLVGLLSEKQKSQPPMRSAGTG